MPRTFRLLGFLSASALGPIGCSDAVPESSAVAGGVGPSAGGAHPAGAGGSTAAGQGQGAGSGNGGSAALGGSGGSASSGGGGSPAVGGAGSGAVGASSGNGASGGAAGSGASAGDTATGGVGASGAAATGGAGQNGGGAGGTATAGASGQGGAGVEPVPVDPSLLSRCSGTNPIRCTIPVPANGNYNVTVELGSAATPSTSRILAELARLQTQPITLAAGEFSKQTFSANVRTEVHDDYEAAGMTLDVVIDGSAPALRGLGFAAAPTIPTLFVAGDSTSCDWDPVYVTNAGNPLERGWAQEFSQYLRPGIAVADYADSGDTAGSLYGKFASRGAVMKPGDFLFIQFGHNDQKDQAAIDAFKANLLKFVEDARSAGATPILFTPVARKTATLKNPGFNGLDGQVRELAESADVALVDLTLLAIAHYESLTPTELDATFHSSTEGTHFSESGATQVAGLVANDLSSSAVSLRDFLK
jgi:lysophospholipase L1-like esterase